MICKKCGKKTVSDAEIEACLSSGETPAINTSYDIPYAAGYSKDGRTIYIDRHMPRSMLYKGKERNITNLLAVHEATESKLIHKLGFDYDHAHHIASEKEKAAVEKAGIPWAAYDNFTERYVKTCEHEKIQKAPKNLDLTPYRDDHDEKDLKYLKEAMQ
jgi:hypothetical protein